MIRLVLLVVAALTSGDPASEPTVMPSDSARVQETNPLVRIRRTRQTVERLYPGAVAVFAETDSTGTFSIEVRYRPCNALTDSLVVSNHHLTSAAGALAVIANQGLGRSWSRVRIHVACSSNWSDDRSGTTLLDVSLGQPALADSFLTVRGVMNAWLPLDVGPIR